MAACAHAGLTFPTTSPAGVLRAGDVVEFLVNDLHGPGTTTAFITRIDEKGEVTLPMLKPVAVAGLTNDAAGPPVAKAYEAAGMISGPVVTATIVATAAQMPVKPGPLAAGDTVRVSIFDLTGPGRRTEVDACVAADGSVTLPALGKLPLAGQTEATAARAISKAYSDQQIMTNAMVHVLRTASGT
ncbi:MAG: polysaccharide biosynthesis/export family protein [Tepidisphaeraceae bacterium]